LFVFAFKLGTCQLTGVINAYTPLTTISSNTLVVASNTDFAVGDKVLAIQMKGATIDLTNTSLYGTISATNNAGNFAFGTISSTVGTTTIVLTASLSAAFTTGGSNRVQLVRVKTVNTNTAVTGNVTPTAWNGTIGGVVVLEVLGTLTINAGCRIDASGRGFRGGAVSGTSDGTAWCNWSEFRSTNIVAACYQGIYAQKGEGIAEDALNDYGRGPLANGGGGSGEHNGGGAGGGNVSPGGDGGRQFTGCPIRRNNTGASCNTPAGGAVQSSSCDPAVVTSTSDVMVGGLGGKSLISGSANNKIFMGGGGGGGQQNGAGGTGGGNGGGIIIVSTNSLVNNSGFSDAIRANGSAAAATTGNEGAGGGGAGGSLIIETSSFNNAITLSAAGGNGGNAVTSNVSCRGPGGGGGGGLIWISGLVVAPVNLTTNILSGSAGSVVCSAPATCGGAAPAANTLACLGDLLFCAVTPTANGVVQANLVLPLPLKLLNFSSLCLSDYTEISWLTTSEVDNGYFVLLKSNDALSWEEVGRVNSNSDAGSENSYSFNDKTANSSNVVYYKLKSVAKDNSVEYSSIIAGKCKANANYNFSVVNNMGLDVKFDKLPYKVSIYNMLGQFVQEIKIDSSLFYHINTFSFAEGAYMIIADYGNQTVTKKVLINYY
jgi:hypothetical protein